MKILKSEKGFLLIAALTLLSALTLVGATAYLLSSTDIKIGGNLKNSQMTLQVAQAGAERAREILRQANAVSTSPDSLSEELAAKVGVNGVLNDPLAGTDDLNVISNSTGSSSMTVGNAAMTYLVYVTNDTQDSNGWLSVTDSNKKAMITSIATGPKNAKAIVQTVVEVFPMVSSPATIYTKGDVTGNGNSLTVSGNDACNSGTNLAPIYTKDPAATTLVGNPTLSGSPGSPQHGTLDLDIQGMINQLKGSASYTLTADVQNGTYGSSSSYKTVYSNTSSPVNANGLTLNNVVGYGILIVEGDLNLGGGFTWDGIILATGAVTLNGGAGPNAINIQGQVLSGTSTVTDVSINGSNTITYNSCSVKKATAQAPLNVVSWKHSF